VAAQFDVLDRETHRKALFEALRARDVYRKLTEELKEKLEKLERGLIGPKSERFKVDNEAQLSLQLLTELLGAREADFADAQQAADELLKQAEAEASAGDGGSGDGSGDEEAETCDPKPHGRPQKPTGRSTKGERVQRVTIELIPEEVKRLGLDAFERIGEERSTTTERRISSLVEVTIVRPKFRAKTAEAVQAVQSERAAHGTAAEANPQSWITVAAVPDAPLPRSMAGPGLLANVIVCRFDDHLPYNRLENVYEREGTPLAHPQICLTRPLPDTGGYRRAGASCSASCGRRAGSC
jgi:hypothetical protein